jgi:adenylate cyclase
MPDWDAEGLLAGLEDERDREARRKLLDELDEQGIPLDELRRAATEERLVLLPVERVLGSGGPQYTLDELAERAGAPKDLAVAHLKAMGAPVPAPEDRLFDDADVESLKRLQRVIAAGMEPDAALEMDRTSSNAMARLADATRATIGESLLRPGDNELDLAHRYAAVAEALTPLIGPSFEYGFNFHLREAIRNDVIDRAARATGRLAFGSEIAVTFADLVGFTPLGETIPPDELGGIVDRLGELANGVAERPVQLIKLIGDAAMLVSPEPAPLLDAALELVEAGEREGGDFPPLRAGVAYGSAINRGGDWYGHPVNLASRLTSVARPSSVLTSEELQDVVGEDRYRWSFAGQRHLKGVRGETKLFRVRPAEAD